MGYNRKHMFIAHLPGGYLLSKKLQKILRTKKYLWFGLIGSVLPDTDMLYFYFIDGQQNHHHTYWIHIPFYWLVIFAFTVLLLYVVRKRIYLPAAYLFFAGIFLHLFLDTIGGDMLWLYPFSTEMAALFRVPAVYDNWIYNFLFHWTFLIEIAILVWSGIMLVRNKKKIH